MKIFDAHIYAHARPDRDFTNMVYFDVERVLIAAAAPKRFRTAKDLYAYFERLTHTEYDRVEALGVTPHIALGVHPRAVPERTHYEIWRELPHLLDDPKVAALGEIGLIEDDDREWAVVERQLRVLADHPRSLPVLFRPPTHTDTRTRRATLEKLAACADDLALPKRDIVILHTDWLTIDTNEALGFTSLLSVNPYFLDPTEVVRVVTHHDTGAIILASSMREGTADVLALPKVAVAMLEAGVAQSDIERLLYRNAMALLT